MRKIMDYGNWYNDSQNNNTNNTYGGYSVRRKTNGFEIASMVMGILSIITCCFGIFSLPLGALGILFALLSRRKGSSMSGLSITGIVTSVIGMLLGILIILGAILTLSNSDFREKYIDPVYEQTYGMDFEEFMEYYGNIMNQ
jgi:hypothetical protein